MRVLAPLMFLLAPTVASAAPTEVTLAKLAMAPKEFKGQDVQVDVSMGMVVAQKMLSQCKGKTKAIQVLPAMEAATSGAPVGTLGAGGTLMFQVCLPLSDALELADVKTGQPLRVTGTVSPKRSAGILIAMVFEDARVEVLEGAAAGVLAASAAEAEPTPEPPAEEAPAEEAAPEEAPPAAE